MRKINWKLVHSILVENSLSLLISEMKGINTILSDDEINALIDEEVIEINNGYPIISDNDYLDYDEFINIINLIFRKE